MHMHMHMHVLHATRTHTCCMHAHAHAAHAMYVHVHMHKHMRMHVHMHMHAGLHDCCYTRPTALKHKQAPHTPRAPLSHARLGPPPAEWGVLPLLLQVQLFEVAKEAYGYGALSSLLCARTGAGCAPPPPAPSPSPPPSPGSSRPAPPFLPPPTTSPSAQPATMTALMNVASSSVRDLPWPQLVAPLIALAIISTCVCWLRGWWRKRPAGSKRFHDEGEGGVDLAPAPVGKRTPPRKQTKVLGSRRKSREREKRRKRMKDAKGDAAVLGPEGAGGAHVL